MATALHDSARTTPRLRAEFQASKESTRARKTAPASINCTEREIRVKSAQPRNSTSAARPSYSAVAANVVGSAGTSCQCTGQTFGSACETFAAYCWPNGHGVDEAA